MLYERPTGVDAGMSIPSLRIAPTSTSNSAFAARFGGNARSICACSGLSPPWGVRNTFPLAPGLNPCLAIASAASVVV